MFGGYLLTKQSRIVVACAVVELLALNSACTANPEPETEEVEFVIQVTITENNAMQFELLDQNVANSETIFIGTNGVLTDAASFIVGATRAVANLTVPATPAQAITILIDADVDGTEYEPTSVRCTNNAGVDTDCNGAAMSATSAASANLLVNATTKGDGLAATEIVHISFDVTVAYH